MTIPDVPDHRTKPLKTRGMKVVINNCFGGFSLSEVAVMRLVDEQFPLESWPWDPNEKFNVSIGRATQAHDLGNGWVRYGDSSMFSSLVKNGMVYSSHLSDDKLRADPRLVRLVEEMGDDACGPCADLKVVVIPEGVDYVIEEYNGSETVAEKHRTWS
jgi:hypothetical protein